MSTAAGTPSNGANAGVKSPESKNKGKAKGVSSPDVSMEEEEEEEDEDEGEDEEMEEEEESEEDSDDEDPEIDPSVIISSGRRTRGVKVDYTSKEALEKAGLKPEDEDDEMDD